MMKLVLRRFVSLVLLAGMSLQAWASTFYGPSINIEGGRASYNSIAYQRIFRVQSSVLRATRGVLMQALARFKNLDGELVPVQNVAIESVKIEGQSYPCLRIGKDPCVRFILANQHLRGLARFVENKRFQAFTLPSSADDEEWVIEQVRRVGMVKAPGSSLMYEDWIAGELATPFFANVFRYVDFDDPYRFSNSSVQKEYAEELRKEMNSKLGNQSMPIGRRIDGTYINADLHAKFVAKAYQGHVVCDGVPARYRWSMYEGTENAYVRNISFAAPDFVDDKHKEYYMNAQSVFCTAAIFRAVQNNRPAALKMLH